MACARVSRIAPKQSPSRPKCDDASYVSQSPSVRSFEEFGSRAGPAVFDMLSVSIDQGIFYQKDVIRAKACQLHLSVSSQAVLVGYLGYGIMSPTWSPPFGKRLG